MASSKARYFFKVFFPDLSTNSLRIPPAFSGQIVAESGRRVALRGPSGSVWKARLVKDSVGFLFEDGWKEFVENHALVMGDFLIFRYKGNSRFDVLVFDMTACEKKEAFLARPSVDNVIEVSDDEEEENKPLVHFRKRRLDENLKKENAVNDLLDESNSKRSKAIYKMGSLISQRRPVTEEEVEKTHQRAMSFKSEHPFAVVIMQDSYVYNSFYMNVPSCFTKVHLPRENTVLTVWDPTDKPWKITYICYGARGVFSGGWGKFSFANNLEKYDVCVFELIKANNLKVHIYRVVEEMTPLIRRPRATNKFI